ncbi:MAG: hypothetical protein HQK83_11350 [Fibrobacteria bacterium]|nr:hypothetical protein [Fibrobacteria bacterium]
MRKNINAIIAIVVLTLFSTGFSHPAWKVENVRPTGVEWPLGAMDFLSDGSLVVADWTDDYSVYIIKNITTGDKAQMTVTKFAQGFREILGMQVLNDSIYVVTKNALMLLLDHDIPKDGIADEYRAITYDWSRTTNEKNYAFGLPWDPVKKCFYVCFNGDLQVAANLRVPQPPGRQNACYEIYKDGEMKIFSGGHRVPAGVDFVYGELWVTENQGGYRPSSPIINVKKGRWYGRQVQTDPLPYMQPHTKTSTTQYNEYAAFAVRLIHQINARSPGNTVGIYSGIFKGQMFVCDADRYKEIGTGGIRRVFVELVNGEYQGCVFDFKRQGEFEGKAVWKLRWGPDGNLYCGGNGSNGGLWERDTPKGLDRLVPLDTVAFEMLAVRSTGSDKFEIEFTKAMKNAAGSDVKGNLSVHRQSFELQDAYGGGEGNPVKLSITSAIVSQDQKKVEVIVPGLVLRDNYNFQWTDNTIYAKDDDSKLLHHNVWYTLNQFGPGNDVPDSLISMAKDYVGVKDGKYIGTNKAHNLTMNIKKHMDGSFTIDISNRSNSVEYDIRVMDLMGRQVSGYKGKGSGQWILKSTELRNSGVYVVHVRSGIESVSDLIMR